MRREARATIPIKDLKSIVFNRERGEVVITKEIQDQPDELESTRFTSVKSWWDGWNKNGMAPLINSGVNVWLNKRGMESATEEGISIEVAVTSVADELRYANEVEKALKSAKESRLDPAQVLLKVKTEARTIALDKRTKVDFVGGYVIGFAESLSDVYDVSQSDRERLKRIATFSKLTTAA